MDKRGRKSGAPDRYGAGWNAGHAERAAFSWSTMSRVRIQMQW